LARRRYDNEHKLMTLSLSLEEFLRRFLLRVLPKGFARVRHFGFLATHPGAARVERRMVAITNDLKTKGLAPEIRTQKLESHGTAAYLFCW